MNWVDFSVGFAVGVFAVSALFTMLLFYLGKTEDDHTNH